MSESQIDNEKEYRTDLESTSLITASVDDTNCDREPIHIPGSIQPHGVLFALSLPELTVVQVSRNIQDVLGVTVDAVLNKPLTCVLQQTQVELIRNNLSRTDIEFINPLQLTVQTAMGEQFFEGVVHRVEGHEDRLLLLEFEHISAEASVTFPHFYHVMRSSSTVLQGASNLSDLCHAVAETVRELTGFDRVMIYRFHPDWHGEVIAEARRADLESYLGLHYPASDIPSQARELYRTNWLRLIADVSYTPAPLVPMTNPLVRGPLNLSAAVLRSVSPMHIMYLKNMGVSASMSVSLIKNGKLWGLISCHHTAANFVPYTVRSACEFLGQMLSLQIASREDVDDYAYEMSVNEILARLNEHLSEFDNPFESILAHADEMLQLVDARGAALYSDEQYFALGEAPSEQDGRGIVDWLQENMHENVFVTDVLPELMPAAESFKAVASGLLAVSISPQQNAYMLWFRPEVARTVTWGGDPHKPMVAQDGVPVLHPRTSFAAWRETVHNRSMSWKQCEIDAAHAVRGVIIDRLLRNLLLQRSEELNDLNEKLTVSNAELDSFAYIVSHDLKEPLRGINNYVNIIKEDYGQQLDAEGVERLNTLLRLTQRLGHLIDSLLHYSRVGRVDLAFVPTDLDEVLDRSLDFLQARLEEEKVSIRVPRPLPTLTCDSARVGEIFSNLITNAIKYNDKAERWIEIGYRTPEEFEHAPTAAPYIFYVKDNGIGIRDRYYEVIFRIFKRLHGRDKFGGGTGAGLTIVRRIVERHHGKIWVESRYGEGSTFYFTLQEG